MYMEEVTSNLLLYSMSFGFGIGVVYVFLRKFVCNDSCIGELDVSEYRRNVRSSPVLNTQEEEGMIDITYYNNMINREQEAEIVEILDNNRFVLDLEKNQYYHIYCKILSIFIEDEILENLSYNSNENEFCSICQSNIEEEESCSKFPCEHFFHDECISDWFKYSDKCPLCMKIIYMESCGNID